MTRLRSIYSIVALLLFLTAAVPVSAASAGPDSVSFTFVAVETGSTIEISVAGLQVTDLYAYDLNFSFDAKRLQFITASTVKTGFTVDPILGEGQVRIAHTKVGKVAGDNGNIGLAKLTFRRIGKGEAVLSLSEAKLVDSRLNQVSLQAVGKVTIIEKGASFKDLSGHWAAQAIQQAVEQGLVHGYEDGTFRPNRPLTRAEFAVMIVRALKLNVGEGTDLSYTDRTRIPAWSRSYVQAAAEAKLLGGYEDQSFRPGQAITREEMAAIMVRVLDLKTAETEKTTFTDAENIAAWAKPAVAAVEKAGLMHGRGAGRFEPRATATRAETVVILLAMLREIGV